MSRWLAVWLCLALLGSPEVSAQMSHAERRHEAQARLALDPMELAILKKEQRLQVDYGFWINHLFSDFKNDDNNARRKDATNATYAIDPRFWVRLTLRPPLDGSAENEQSVYVRLKDKLTWRDPSDVNGNFDHDGPHVDYAFLSLDLRPLWLQMGRRFYQVGQGIAYSDVGDGAELLAASSTASLMGFVTRSLPHTANLDQSVPGGKDSGRLFFGVEGRYLGIRHHGLYSYALFEWDDSHEEPEDVGQDFDYEAQFFGLGAEGKLLTNLRYAAEVIFETGDSVLSSTKQQADIRASAYDVSLTYDIQLPWQPTVYGEYAFGSGDSDRTNVTDTVGGNTAGRDTNFLYFGYLPTGYALSPRLSNLRMLKAGASLKPLGWLRWCKDFTTRADVYWYWKEEARGGIFDLDATETARYVGYELDFAISWPILSDMSLGIEYGLFEPGSTYPASTNDETRYLSVSVTTTF